MLICNFTEFPLDPFQPLARKSLDMVADSKLQKRKSDRFQSLSERIPCGFHAESIKIARRIKVKRTDSNSLNYNQQVSRTPGKIKHKTGRAGQRQTFHERQLPPRSLGVWARALHLSALIHTGTRISKRTERVREGTPSPCPAFRAYMWVSFAIVGWTINSYRQ